jgi:hypothetical protein
MNKNNSRHLALLAVIATGVLPVTGARAQNYGATYAQPAPLYPYAVQPDRPYAVEVAPGTYVIQRPAASRAYPYVRCQKDCGHHAGNPAPEQTSPRFDRPHQPVDHALVEELRNRSQVKREVVNTKKIVRDPPIVVETQRVVDDPPRIIERRHAVEDEPAPARRKQAAAEERETDKHAGRNDTKKRVIEADAEVTILGPDRMSIRLFRKGQGPNARAD